MPKQPRNHPNPVPTIETLSAEDKQLFYPVLLLRQFGRMINSLALFLLLCAACFAEIDQLAQHWFGAQGEWLSVVFVLLLALSVRWIYSLLQDFIDDVKSGKRLQNSYTLITSIAALIATLSLLQFQLKLINEEGSLSIFKLLWKMLF